MDPEFHAIMDPEFGVKRIKLYLSHLPHKMMATVKHNLLQLADFRPTLSTGCSGCDEIVNVFEDAFPNWRSCLIAVASMVACG